MPDATLHQDDEDCWMCGGSGVLEDECTCGDDTCCCLEPEPPECPECIYRERRRGTEAAR
jgi:hypothetical protein